MMCAISMLIISCVTLLVGYHFAKNKYCSKIDDLQLKNELLSGAIREKELDVAFPYKYHIGDRCIVKSIYHSDDEALEGRTVIIQSRSRLFIGYGHSYRNKYEFKIEGTEYKGTRFEQELLPTTSKKSVRVTKKKSK